MPLTRAFALATALLLGSGAVAHSQSRSSINLADRDAVLAAWTTEYNRTEPAIEWTGDASACNGGTTSAMYQQSILQRVNWFRNMAGLPDISYRADLNAQQQAGALISAANNSLSHTPDSSWKCWTQAGYDANRSSNLALGISGVGAVDAYIDDLGDNNKPVGHRWWLFHPGLKTITSGDLPRTANTSATNAIRVADVDWSVTASRDGFVAWPPPGYVPYHVVYPRWSVMTFAPWGSQSDFSNATVTVTGPNGPVDVIYDHRSAGRIVFVPAGFERAPLKVSSDQKYTVNVTGVNGGPRSSYTYDVVVAPSNFPPSIVRLTTGSADTCSKKGALIARLDFNDRESDVPVSMSLIDGDGSGDNSRFAVTQPAGGVTQWLSAVIDLDGTKRDFSVRLRITDSRGASADAVHTFSLSGNPNGRCRSSTATRGDAGTSVSRTQRRDVTASVPLSSKTPLRSFTTLPTGVLSYSSTGSCSLTANKRAVITSSVPGLCTISISGRTATLTSIVVVYLRVQ